MAEKTMTLSKSREKTQYLVQVAFFAAIIGVLASTPLGFVQLPIIKATTVHIPVIIGAILLGPKAGAILGGVFGLTSLINNTMSPSLVSFCFTPFYDLNPEFQGGIGSLIICFVPRILIGVGAAYLFKALSKVKVPSYISLPVCGFVGSMINTIFVMGGIYLIFGESYAAAKEIAFEALLGVIMGVVGANGVPEAIVAAIITLAVAKPLMKVIKKD